MEISLHLEANLASFWKLSWVILGLIQLVFLYIFMLILLYLLNGI